MRSLFAALVASLWLVGCAAETPCPCFEASSGGELAPSAIDLVPSQAFGAMMISEAITRESLRGIADDEAMMRELDEFLGRTFGVNPLRARELFVFAIPPANPAASGSLAIPEDPLTAPDTPPNAPSAEAPSEPAEPGLDAEGEPTFGLAILMSTEGRQLVGSTVETRAGVAIVRWPDEPEPAEEGTWRPEPTYVHGALLPGALVIGQRTAVQAAIDSAMGMDVPDTGVRDIIRRAGLGNDVVGHVDLRPLELEVPTGEGGFVLFDTITVGSHRRGTLRVEADFPTETAATGALGAIQVATAAAVAEMEQMRAEALEGDSPFEGALAIVGYHMVNRMIERFTPTRVEDRLVLDLDRDDLVSLSSAGVMMGVTSYFTMMRAMGMVGAMAMAPDVASPISYEEERRMEARSHLGMVVGHISESTEAAAEGDRASRLTGFVTARTPALPAECGDVAGLTADEQAALVALGLPAMEVTDFAYAVEDITEEGGRAAVRVSAIDLFDCSTGPGPSATPALTVRLALREDGTVSSTWSDEESVVAAEAPAESSEIAEPAP